MHTILRSPGFPDIENRLRHRPGRGFGRLTASLLVAGLEVLAAWQERAADRYRLAALDDRMLSDMGLSRADAEPEIRKPFWRA